MKTKVPTLSEAARLVYKRTYNGTDSAQNFLIAMKHNIKAIGDLPVNKITTPVVNKMMDYLRDELKNSKAVINTKRGYLKIVLEHMVYDGHIKEEIKLPKRHRVKGHKVHYLTKDMEDDLLTWLLDYDERAFHIVQALIDLGCRVNELLNLERRFVDMPNNQINFNERKNDKAVAVPMTQRVILIMQANSMGKKPTDKLFDVDYTWLNAVWQKARKELGYAKEKYYTLHLCRHTCASRLVQRGVPLLLVKDWLGHEDIQTTMIYAHLAPKALHSVVEVLN